MLDQYQRLLEQSNLERSHCLKLLLEKDKFVHTIIREREDYKDKYISNLEAQVKQRDEMLSTMFATLAQTLRSHSELPRGQPAKPRKSDSP